jgi:hypothetical protein
MAVFTPGKAIVTDTPAITVDGGLTVGKHRFTLEVVDDQGNQSPSASLDVTIYRQIINPIPIPIPTPIPGRPIPGGPI